MIKKITPLLISQFLSAFADNAVLFTVIALVMQAPSLAPWYVPALQSVFLLAFVFLAPWIGSIADQHAKSKVLLVGNLIKACGTGLLVINLEPLLAYLVVGTGAALYSPAKYGILPELVSPDELVKANGWIEGSTIFAILLGMVIGAKIADYSIMLALVTVIIIYLSSALVTWLIPVFVARPVKHDNHIMVFIKQTKSFFLTSRARFAILSASLFWATAATLRVILVAWAPVVLSLKSASDIAQLTLFLALGIIIGSALVPKLIPLIQLRRVRFPALLMGLFIAILSTLITSITAKTALFVIGITGGMFIVPVNAALQDIGQKSIGSGGAVAIQGFFQNLAMLIGVGLYTLAASLQVGPVPAMLFLGCFVILAVLLVSFRLPHQTSST